MGGKPEVGNRNTFIHRVVSCLRGICDNDANLLQSITPSFGLSEKEVSQIIKSATREPVKGLWKEMKRVLATYAENIRFHHATGEDGHKILMSAIIGDFGKGKSLLCKQAQRPGIRQSHQPHGSNRSPLWHTLPCDDR